MSRLVTELNVIEENGNIFDTDVEYIIPLYQRAYAWEDKQLTQLVEDIKDVSKRANYYIGSLIVSKQSGRYEVVDGQQRLTSLYLLLNCLGIKTKPNLTFACREKSNYTLKNIEELLGDNRSKLDMDRIESSIFRGIKILSHEVEQHDFDKKDFIEKLKKVKIYRIEVPEHTDLNRYFEIMNTRGEQLEQHDILKTKLMSYLSDDSERGLFSKIWDACSDMTGYVQMHFASKENSVREVIFGPNWSNVPSNNWEDYKKNMTEIPQQISGLCICKLSEKSFNIEDDDGYVDGDIRVRFESIIEFPYFLLHTLKVYIKLYDITHERAELKIVDELLDDKKLMYAFDKVIEYGVAAGLRLADSKENKAFFARTFILCLLRTRFLFDKYIIKREYTNDNTEGEWSLKSLLVSEQQSKKKAYYSNTKFTEDEESDWGTKTNIMIQSALRVSYTSPKVMHWITKLLIWISENDCQHLKNHDIAQFDKIAEKNAIDAVKENFFDACPDGNYAMGVHTPHIVFNYLDYLLWYDDRSGEKRYGDFVFEFRNSVEHWYPQNPSEGTFESWKDDVDQFGNLCIIQHNVNSKFSNMSPEAKKSTFKGMIAKGSIKLRIMSELTQESGDKAASIYWKETVYKFHEDEMICYLKKACQIE